MATKPKTCGICKHTMPAGSDLVWCYGAPPTVTGVTAMADGKESVTSRRPLLPVTTQPCSMFVQRPRR